MRRTFEDYIDRATQIRELATPHLRLIDREERYGEILKAHFRRIGELSAENRRVISDELTPMMLDPDSLTGEEIDELIAFARVLINAYHLETLDPALGWYISDFLYRNVYERMELARQLKLLELHLTACYNMCLKTRRIESVSPLSRQFHRQGMEIFQRFEGMLDRLEELPDEASRTRVIRNTRYGHCMYEGERSDAAARIQDVKGLERLLQLGEDETVRALVPGFDWDHHRFRTLEYLALSVDYGNIRGFTREETRTLNRYAAQLEQMWRSDPEHYETMTPGGRVILARLLNAYYAGEMKKEAYKQALLHFFGEDRKKGDYGRGSIYGVYHAALAYMMCVREDELTKEDEQALTTFYESIMDCALHSRETAVESYVLELIALVLENFIEVPEVDFERMVLTCMAALHTPTYIHSLMVGCLSVSLTEAALARNPEVFVGLMGCADTQQVQDKKDAILDHILHAALLHDAGKTPIIDTIFVYERNLFDFEFNDIIKMHPLMGRHMLQRNASTSAFCDIAAGHHRWYDDSFGYPPDMVTKDSPYKVLIDIVECADCMDAATDSIGRSYSRGKSLKGYTQEVCQEAGTRYAPWLADLLEDPQVFGELERIITLRREENYRDTYWLLKD